MENTAFNSHFIDNPVEAQSCQTTCPKTQVLADSLSRVQLLCSAFSGRNPQLRRFTKGEGVVRTLGNMGADGHQMLPPLGTSAEQQVGVRTAAEGGFLLPQPRRAGPTALGQSWPLPQRRRSCCHPSLSETKRTDN